MSSTSRSLRSYRHAAFSDDRSNPRHSDDSDHSAQSTTTAPTSVSASPRPSLKSTHQPERSRTGISYSKTPRSVVVVQPDVGQFEQFSHENHQERAHHRSIPRSSRDTYASIRTQDIYDEPEEYDDDQDFAFDLPDDLEQYVSRGSDAEVLYRETSPQNFADYFPSLRRLFIHHDESTHDGNMNLKVDTEEADGDRKAKVQLFHLRMRDLESREFSLRRYCRDSGREVCKSLRRYQLPSSERPGIQRSVSNALAVLRPDFKRTHSKDSAQSVPVRADSGYGSDDEVNDDGEDYFGRDDVDVFMHNAAKSSHAAKETPTRSIKLEFSNYAQVDVKRQGAKKSKHYDFEYWGTSYSWKRVVHKTENIKTVEYHLVRHGSNKEIAHIVPLPQTARQLRDEQAQGGWVPPCSLWISDPTVLTAYTDVADVIISTGLIALVDDCIKRRFDSPHKKSSSIATSHLQLQVPLTPLKMEMDFTGPKALVNHMFRRRSSGSSSSARSEAAEHTHMKQSLSRNRRRVERA